MADDEVVVEQEEEEEVVGTSESESNDNDEPTPIDRSQYDYAPPNIKTSRPWGKTTAGLWFNLAGYRRALDELPTLP